MKNRSAVKTIQVTRIYTTTRFGKNQKSFKVRKRAKIRASTHKHLHNNIFSRNPKSSWNRPNKHSDGDTERGGTPTSPDRHLLINDYQVVIKSIEKGQRSLFPHFLQLWTAVTQPHQHDLECGCTSSHNDMPNSQHSSLHLHTFHNRGGQNSLCTFKTRARIVPRIQQSWSSLDKSNLKEGNPMHSNTFVFKCRAEWCGCTCKWFPLIC